MRIAVEIGIDQVKSKGIGRSAGRNGLWPVGQEFNEKVRRQVGPLMKRVTRVCIVGTRRV